MNDFENAVELFRSGWICSQAMLSVYGAPLGIDHDSLPALLVACVWVTRAWLKKQHPKWLKEMEHAGKLEVYGEEKKPAAH
jgi:cytochrome b subunit of formate dehydrogenase